MTKKHHGSLVYKPESELSESEVRTLYERLRKQLEGKAAIHKEWRDRPENKAKRKAWLDRWKERNPDKYQAYLIKQKAK